MPDFRKDDNVMVYISSSNSWVPGVVTEYIEKDGTFRGYRVTKGMLMVTHAKGIKWILPNQVSSCLRKMDGERDFLPGDDEARAAAELADQRVRLEEEAMAAGPARTEASDWLSVVEHLADAHKTQAVNTAELTASLEASLAAERARCAELQSALDALEATSAAQVREAAIAAAAMEQLRGELAAATVRPKPPNGTE
eukprot:NODE_21306_length_760_cov_2.055292.p1 GENE.NODE_21306_length_760_cov_2.055292~~NODE_21306_length_760_cov_2.055292.p1  ORF type:complete len:197 (+),score=45.53 NODE_21306_length_760_cov_2.055292:107-697(+)